MAIERMPGEGGGPGGPENTEGTPAPNTGANPPEARSIPSSFVNYLRQRIRSRQTDPRPEAAPGGSEPPPTPIPDEILNQPQTPPTESPNPADSRPDLEPDEKAPAEALSNWISKLPDHDQLVALGRRVKQVEKLTSSDEYLQTLKERDPEAYQKHIETMAQSSEIFPELEEPLPPAPIEGEGGEEREGIDTLIVRNYQGLEIPYQLPGSKEGKIRWMRDRLGVAELSPESFSEGTTAAQYITQISEAIRGLETYANEGRVPTEKAQEFAEAADAMRNELQARAGLQAYFQIYARTVDAETLANNSWIMKADYFNTLFRIKEVQAAFFAYETRAEEFVAARGTEKERIQKEIAEVAGGAWAQRLGERLWRITGRAVYHDYTRIKDPSKPPEEQALEFAGEGAGGDFVLRRIHKFKDWLQTNRAVFSTFEQLLGDPKDEEARKLGMKQIDLRVKDMWSDIYGSFAQKLIAQDAERSSRDITKEKFGEISNNMNTKANSIFDRVETEEVKKGDGTKDYEIIKKINHIDFNQLDFNLLQEGFFPTYMSYNVAQPEGSRGHLVDFLRTPNANTLTAFVNDFAYQGPDQHGTKAKLASNFYTLIRDKKLAQEAGLVKADRRTTETLINILGKDLKMKRMDIENIAKEQLGEGVYNNLLLTLSYFRTDRFMLSFIASIIAGVVKASLKA